MSGGIAVMPGQIGTEGEGTKITEGGMMKRKRVYVTTEIKQAAVAALKAGTPVEGVMAKYSLGSKSALERWARGEGLRAPGGSQNRKERKKAKVRRGNGLARITPMPMLPADAKRPTIKFTT